jgi:putative ABC transport system permease protein
MFRNYLKIAVRNLWRNKAFSAINIFGLAIGLTTCMLIMLYVADEISYDKHHKDGDRIYRIASEVKGEKWVAAPAPMAAGLKREFPEVEQVTRLLRFPGAEKMLLKNEQNQSQFFETNAYYVDSTFFELFTYSFLFGNSQTALHNPNTLVISEEIATRLFGHENPVDKVVKIGLSFGEFDYTIKGVFKDTGHPSHIPAHVLLSMRNGDVGSWVNAQTSWASNSIFHSYVKLTKESSPQGFESKLAAFLEQNGGAEMKAAGFSKTLFIQPLEDIYLHSNYGYEIAPNGNSKYLYVFSSIAVFLLLIACVNFMNLSTARSEKRAREVGMRKVIGASRSALVGQFLSESLLMSILALAFACLFIQLSIPGFNQLTGKELSLLQLPHVFLWLLILTLVTGLLSGLYPAFYLSSFQPIAVLKGKLLNTVTAGTIRRGLVVFQFTISTVLILGAIVIRQQMHYLSNQNLGFSKNQKIVLPLQTTEANANVLALKNQVLSYTPVISAAQGGAYPGMESITSMLFSPEGKANEHVDIQTVAASEGYIETLGLTLLQGRGFSSAFANDQDALVLNETAVRQLGYAANQAIGKKISYEFQNETHTMTIVGVVKDYHYQSLHQTIKPLALTVHPFFGGPTSYLIAEVKSQHYPRLIADLETVWKKINPNSPFSYSFLDQDFQKNYVTEERTSYLIRYFTLIGVCIACLGLFGLAAYTAERRRKEIGIRKVLGATVGQIVTLLSTDFLKLVIIAFVIAVPLAWYATNQWLANFAYRIAISWWIFVLAGILAVVIAFVTVSYQAVKAALANPVKSLRSE